MYVVILAGGGGTRLWPLSSAERPKPFLPLLGSETLLQRTVHRLFAGQELADRGLGLGDVTVVTDRRYAGLVKEQLPGVRILAEPAGRNTAAAVTLAVAAIDRPDDEVMIVLPADQWIADEPLYRAVLANAEAGLARQAFGIDDPLVTLGIAVDRPATEFGYLIPIMAGAATSTGCTATRSRRSSRSRTRPVPSSCASNRASPGTRGSSCGAVGRSGMPWSAIRRCSR